MDGDKLYGRGGADDGYAMFAALSALLALRDQGVPHARCVILIEACEESGSLDLPFYVDHLASRIGEPSLVVCLDSGCGDYERMWLTTSLRGTAIGSLTVRVLEEGVHSGDASGIVPSSFRILRQLHRAAGGRDTGAILPKELYVEIPEQRVAAGEAGGAGSRQRSLFQVSVRRRRRPVSHDLAELVLNRTWRPQLSVTGMEGLPAPQNAGNVMLPYTTAKLSLRLPPTLDGETAGADNERRSRSAPPYNAKVAFDAERAMSGWNAPALAPWLEKSVERASQTAFGAPPALWAKAAAFRSWRCWARNFPGRNSS